MLISHLVTDFIEIFDRNSNIFVQESAFENSVCEMASILSRQKFNNFARWIKYIRMHALINALVVDSYNRYTIQRQFQSLRVYWNNEWWILQTHRNDRTYEYHTSSMRDLVNKDGEEVVQMSHNIWKTSIGNYVYFADNRFLFDPPNFEVYLEWDTGYIFAKHIQERW